MKNSGIYFERILPLLIMLAMLGLSQSAWAVTPQICSGANHTVALRSDGTIWASGSNSAGQIGNGSGTNHITQPVQVGLPGNSANWVAVAAGVEHTLALKADGSLWAWGANQFGQLGDGSGTNKSAPVRIGTGNNWASVAAGGGSSFALKADGTLWAWGKNNLGQLGNADPAATPADQPLPVQVSNPGGSPFVAVAAGAQHTLALQADGSLWGWGSNQYGQIAQSTADQSAHSTPLQIGEEFDWASPAAGGLHALALKADGSLWTWGRNNVGQLGIGVTDSTPHTIPVQVGTGRDWLALSAGDLHTLAVKRNGTLWAWGDNSNGQLGDGTNTDRNKPVQLSILSDGTLINNIVAVAAGALHSMAAKANGELHAWGANGSGQFGDNTTVGSFLPFLVGTDVVSWVGSEPGGDFTVARKSNGTLWTWGNNGSGQLGDNTFTQRLTPVMVGAASNWIAQSSGFSHTVALQADGTLWTWGDNTSGQLGDGTTSNSAATKQITVTQPASAANDWTAVAAGDFHSLAMKSDGTLWAWGDNSSGQLGDGTTISKSVPVLIEAAIGNHWAAIAAGGTHTLALQSDGTIWSWGDNGTGQLGDSAFGVSSNTPRQIVNFTPPTPGYNSSWVAIAAGLSHSLALQADGTLWAWGGNNNGQLGNGNSASQNVPVQVPNPGTTLFVAVTAGDSYSVARLADGSLWSWGNNTSGQLGIGSTDPDPLNPTANSTPVRESTNSNNWVSAGSGGKHTIALKADGTLWALGSNSAGQLGDGTTIDKNSFASFTEARINVSPGTLAFNTVAIAVDSSQLVTITNTGTAPLSVNSLNFGGPDSALFSVKAGGGTCSTVPFTLATTGSCTVKVVFRPAAPGGAKNAMLTFASNDPNSPAVAVALSGLAVVQYTLTASVSSGSPAGSGTITPSGAVLVPDGESRTFTITPNVGYHVVDVTMGGVSQGPVTSVALPSVKADASITAIFAINTYTVTKTAVNGSIAGPATVNHGDAASYAIAPTTGYHIADVAVDGVSQGAVTTISLTAVTANKVITASFAINAYAIIATADAKGNMTPAIGNVSVNHGANQIFTFTPNTGYSVVNVIVDGVSQGSITSFTFTNVTNGNHTIKLICIPDGDVNNDGKVEIADALLALRITVGLVTPGVADTLHGDVAPVDSIGVPLPDKQITVADALMILRKVVGLTTGW